MMPVIRVSDDVVNILKKYAIPLEDTHDSVLRRILNEYDMLKSNRVSSAQFPSSHETQTQTSSYGKFPRPHVEREAKWIIEALTQLGGSAHAGIVISQIEKNHGNEFTKEDMKTIPSGEIRWVKKVNWARYDMAKGGLLNPNSPRGVWELTEKGKKYYKI
jgi:hypothetical protein